MTSLHCYIIDHNCYSLPENENIAAHYNDYHHRNLAYVPANTCLLLFAIVVNTAAVKVLYQEYIIKFWIFEIGRYMVSWGFYTTIHYKLLFVLFQCCHGHHHHPNEANIEFTWLAFVLCFNDFLCSFSDLSKDGIMT